MLNPEYIDISKMIDKNNLDPQILAQIQLHSEEKPLKTYSFKEASTELDSITFDP